VNGYHLSDCYIHPDAPVSICLSYKGAEVGDQFDVLCHKGFTENFVIHAYCEDPDFCTVEVSNTARWDQIKKSTANFYLTVFKVPGVTPELIDPSKTLIEKLQDIDTSDVFPESAPARTLETINDPLGDPNWLAKRVPSRRRWK